MVTSSLPVMQKIKSDRIGCPGVRESTKMETMR